MRNTLFNSIVTDDLSSAKLIVSEAGRASQFWRNINGLTPLMASALYGKKPFIHLFYQSGADINEINHARYSALHLALMHGDYDAVEYLVYHKANVNHQNNTGNTALHFAINQDNCRTASLLLSYGADPFLTNDDGENPITLSSKKNKDIYEIISIFIESSSNQKILDNLIDANSMKESNLSYF